jgi:hypothetical protein
LARAVVRDEIVPVLADIGVVIPEPDLDALLA